MQVTWALGIPGPKALFLYRDDELLARLPMEATSYEDTDLDPNTRYAYRLVVEQHGGARYSGEGNAATLAYRPKIAEQVATTWNGFQQPIVDARNPDHTEYKITLTRRSDGLRWTSDWDASRCRVFGDLPQRSFFRISVVARNLDGVVTAPASELAGQQGGDHFPGIVFTRIYAGTEDPWVKARIQDAAALYGLTDAAVEWMTNDILIQWERGEPGWASHLYGRAQIGHSYMLSFMHEAMHAFWQFWDGFPEPCDQMNFYTFRRDVAQFILDFRDHELSDSPNPWEPWRYYYDHMVRLLTWETPQGEDVHEVLERGEYAKRWGLYHNMETSIPIHTRGHMSLVPPPLRKYMHGFMQEGENRTWNEELGFFFNLSWSDSVLWHRTFLTYEMASSALHPVFANQSRVTTIPEPLRGRVRALNRQMLVDFINTLEYLKPWEWRDQSPGFWSRHVRRHLYRFSLYGEELSPSIGVELEQASLDAVVEALQALHDLHCTREFYVCDYNAGNQDTSVTDVPEVITNLEGLSDVQRRVLLEMVDLGGV